MSDKYASTVIVKSADPEEIAKADLDLLKKINEVAASIPSTTTTTTTTSPSTSVPLPDRLFAVDIVSENTYNNTVVLTKSGEYIVWGGDTGAATAATGSSNMGIGVPYGQAWPPTKVKLPMTEKGKITLFKSYMGWGYVLYDTGNFYQWGVNQSGQLGLGNTTVTWMPTLSSTNVLKVCKRSHCIGGGNWSFGSIFILKTDGHWYGCGYNVDGAIGLGNFTTPITSWTLVAGLDGAQEVWVAGAPGAMTIAQWPDYSIKVCGYNGLGQLGLGDTTKRNVLTLTTNWGTPADGPIENVVSGSEWNDPTQQAGYWTGILRRASNGATTLRIAGRNTWGITGNGNFTTPITTPNKVTFTGSDNIKKIAAIGGGPGTIYALTNDNKLWRWGINNNGQIGNGATTPDFNLPYNSGNPNNVDNKCTDIAMTNWDKYTYSYQTCAFIKDTDGYWWATGTNLYGQCALGTITNPITSFALTYVPKEVYKIVQIGYGVNDAALVGLSTDGQIWMWGGAGGNRFDVSYVTAQTTPFSKNLMAF